MIALRKLLKRSQASEVMVWHSLPLARSVLCVDCAMVSVALNDCPMCGSRSVLNLAAVLEREAAVELPHAGGEACCP